ncbi:hypothetical protein [Undibacterium luofuense]|uniref:Uncharacterized protein n=1 Tax=Undibacterium luofuense TaxID=2828733 RepID=A0A941DLZ9_9BURK|nr:hypothetical protein [Undibacterium luofuense]MBR7782074.1 hypothetical protein [Undibacterium luofuense]
MNFPFYFRVRSGVLTQFLLLIMQNTEIPSSSRFPLLYSFDWPNRLAEMTAKWVFFTVFRFYWLLLWFGFAPAIAGYAMPLDFDTDWTDWAFYAYLLPYPVIEALIVLVSARVTSRLPVKLGLQHALTGVVLGSAYVYYFGELTALIEVPFMVLLATIVNKEKQNMSAFRDVLVILWLTRAIQLLALLAMYRMLYFPEATFS